MSKLKINSGLAAIILIGSLFAGWQTMLIVVLLMLIFCEIDEKIKNLATSVIAFFVGITLISILWSLIHDGVSLIFDGLETVIGVINSYLSIGNQINITKLELKVIEPIESILSLGDSLVDFLILFTKFGFIISVFTGAAMKNNYFTRKVNEYINKALGFINNYGLNQAPVNVQNNINNQNRQDTIL